MPSRFELIVKAMVIKTQPTRQLLERFIWRHTDAVGAIIALIRPIRPSAVFSRVWTVVVDSLQGETFGTFSHIRQERGEAIFPFGAHGNAPRPVPREIGMPLVVATRERPLPYNVLSRSGESMRSSESAGFLNSQTPTRFSYSRRDSVRIQKRYLSAIAQALPNNPSPIGRSSPFRNTQNGESIEFLSRYIVHGEQTYTDELRMSTATTAVRVIGASVPHVAPKEKSAAELWP